MITFAEGLVMKTAKALEVIYSRHDEKH